MTGNGSLPDGRVVSRSVGWQPPRCELSLLLAKKWQNEEIIREKCSDIWSQGKYYIHL